MKNTAPPKNLKKIKILHVGNIANNAYLSAKLLRQQGLQADVLCYDYYHIMGTPEWEDAEIKGDWGNDFNPDWSKVDLGNFKRPDWFIQGPLETIARNHFKIEIANYPMDFGATFFAKIATLISVGQSLAYKFYLRRFHRPKKFSLPVFSFLGKIFGLITGLLIRYLTWAQKQLIPQKMRILEEARKKEEYAYYRQLIKDFRQAFPERKDKLTMRDIYPYLYRARIFKEIFKKYDLVQGYATDPIYALLANKHPYVAFEHGTIRDIPFEKSALGRLTALAYRKADLVFITNADNLLAAKKLGLKNIVPLPHPVLDNWHKKYQKANQSKNQSEIILFCPVRHDFAVKKTDLYLRTLPKVVKKTQKALKIIFLEWGMDVAESKKMIQNLGIEKNVEWRRPMPRWELAYWMEKADIILDQLLLPAMGATAPEAMLAGKPVLMSYRHNVCQWMYPDEPPIVKVSNPQDIARELIKLINNPSLRIKHGKAGKKWFRKFHSSNLFIKKVLVSYKKILEIKDSGQ